MSETEQFDKYTLLRKLATGGMAEIHLARVQGPMGFEKLVVLKKMLPEVARDESMTKMFLSEAKLAGTFSHPNIAQVFDFGERNGTYYLAMEYVDGPTLRQVKRRAEHLGVKLPCDVVAAILARACEGLHYVHEVRGVDGNGLGLVHRDISPDNIILSRNGNVKVLDFGIVTSTAVESYTKSGQVRGKLAYMPPEQVSAEVLDRRVDVWALGMCLYEMLTLRRPYDATQDAAVMKAILFEPFIPILEVRPDVPPALVEVIDRCLQKDRSNRYPSARELQGALEHFVTTQGPALGSYEIEGFVRELTEGNAPRKGAATMPATPLHIAMQTATVQAATPAPVLALPPPAPAPTTNQRTPPEPEPAPVTATTTLDRPPRRPRWALGIVGLGLLALVGTVLGLRAAGQVEPQGIVVKGPTPLPAPVPEQPPPAPPPEPVAPAPVAEAPAPEPAPAPAQVPVAEPAPRPVKVAGKKRGPTPAAVAAAPKPAAVPVDVRVLPEGEAEVDGSPWQSGALVPGQHQVRFVSRRFGDVARPVTVPPCEGRVLIGYSFSSDKLTTTCKAR